MVQLEKKDMKKIAALFDGWNETPIWSCLQGIMGNAWADHIEDPKSAQILTGDICFFAGVPNIEPVKNLPESSQSVLAIPQNEGWADLIEQEYKNKCRRLMRYAIKKEPDVFDKEKLNSFIERIPKEFKIERIDEALYNKGKAEKWSSDLCALFPTYQGFEKYGLGFAAVHNGEIVSGASSYTVYDKGIEIEIDTKKKYRKKGLALACASMLILECLERGLYPSWDAANTQSAALAQKLGYHIDHEYVAYEINFGTTSARG
jgi:hypothetical protein